MHINFGVFLGNKEIDGIKIDIFSNGSSNFVSDKISYDDNNHYLGICYQCVELVRRFIYRRHKINLAIAYQDGDAKDWYDNHDKMSLSVKSIDKAKIGDVITFTGGNWGHVGIVSDIDAENIYMTSQNFMNDETDIDLPIAKQALKMRKPILDGNNNKFIFQSILRYEK